MGVVTIAEIYAGLHDTEHARWTQAVLTYSVPGLSSTWSVFDYPLGDESSNADYGVLNAGQGLAFAQAMTAWGRLVNLTFLQVADNAAGAGDIRIAFTDVNDYSDPDTIAYAYAPPPPGFGNRPYRGDIWLDEELKDADPSIGGYLYETLLHEIGHALGLKHPFEDALLPAEFNNTRFTVMAYDDFEDSAYRYFYRENGQIFAATFFVQPETPMLLDVVAIQGLYGAAAVAAGDDVYTIDPTRPFMKTLVDTGGLDTLDLSNHFWPSLVSLAPGTFSSIGYASVQAQIAAWKAFMPDADPGFIARYLEGPGAYTFSNNLALSLDTVIEVVRAGSGDDLVVGNAANNSLFGNAGSDDLYGGLGADTIDGGSAFADGNYLRGDEGDDSVSGGANFDDANGNMGNDTVSTGGGDDFCVGGKDNDVLSGGDGADLVYGNLGDDTAAGDNGSDTVRGGQGADSLSGGAGADFLSGDRGDDTMTGGAGADLFHSSADAGIDRVLDFNSAEGDRVLLDPGTTFTVSQVGADTVIQMSAGQVVLMGVTFSSLPSGFIIG